MGQALKLRLPLALLGLCLGLLGCPDAPTPIVVVGPASAPAKGVEWSFPDAAPADSGSVAAADSDQARELEALEADARPLRATSVGRAGVLRAWTGLHYPRALAASPAGDLYVIDKSGWIRRIDPSGAEVARGTTPAIAEGTPSAMAWHPAGELVVADSHYGQVLRYDPELRLLARFGRHGREAGRFMLLTGVACDAEGRIYVSDQGDDVARVQVFDREGKLLSTFGQFGSRLGELNRPMGLAIRGDEVAVADSLNHRVQVFSLSGEPLRTVSFLGDHPGEVKHPYGVSYLGEVLLVAELGNHRVQAFGPKGQSLGVFGGPGRDLGKLESPWAVLALGERVFVTDGGNDRVYELAAGVFDSN